MLNFGISKYSIREEDAFIKLHQKSGILVTNFLVGFMLLKNQPIQLQIIDKTYFYMTSIPIAYPSQFKNYQLKKTPGTN